MKLLNYILLGLIIVGIFLFFFYRGEMNAKLHTANTLKKEWRSQYLNLLQAKTTTDTIYQKDTITITRHIKAYDSVYVRDTVEVCNYIRTYRDSIIRPDLAIRYGFVTQGILLDTKFSIEDTRPTLIEKRVVYEDKIIEKEVFRSHLYLDAGYNFRGNPMIGINYIYKNKWGINYSYNDGHTVGIKIRLK